MVKLLWFIIVFIFSCSKLAIAHEEDLENFLLSLRDCLERIGRNEFLGPSSDTDKALDNSPMRLKICDKICFAPDFTPESSFSDAMLLSQLLLLHRFWRKIFSAQNCAFTEILDCKKMVMALSANPKGRNVERALGPSCPCVLCISHSLGLYLLHQI